VEEIRNQARDGLTAAAEASVTVQRLREFARWVGAGRRLTQTGRITLADARELVALLQTGDKIDPKFGDRIFKTKSSEDLLGLNQIVEWAKASRLIQVSKGRLLPVKKRLPLLGRPLELWERVFEVFPLLGHAVCPSGLLASLLGQEFEPVMTAVLTRLYRGRLPFTEACELTWGLASERYVLGDGSEQHREMWRRRTDHDTERALQALEALGAIEMTGADEDRTIELTALGLHGVRRLLGEAGPGEPVYQLRVTLLDVSDPPVWRRLQVPARVRLDRLHSVLQAAMGWEDAHLHMFEAGRRRFGDADPELEFEDERKVRLADLVARKGTRIGYLYDFGDSWDHQIEVEETLVAEADVRYPVCLAGEGACPPEDCGGAGGYQRVREALADPADPEHDEVREWLGLDGSSDVTPGQFDLDQVNRALLAIH
jgi:hypothetical protein